MHSVTGLDAALMVIAGVGGVYIAHQADALPRFPWLRASALILMLSGAIGATREVLLALLR